jgi:ketosteroid isomerase-like protein
VFYLYGDDVDWIEMPTGRRGGREELFAVLRGAREAIGEYRFTVISIVADGDQGVLESDWSGRSKEGGEPMEVRVLWFWGFRDGKIAKQHDYSFPMNDAAKRAYAAVEGQ